jgi:hypothetical protein
MKPKYIFLALCLLLSSCDKKDEPSVSSDQLPQNLLINTNLESATLNGWLKNGFGDTTEFTSAWTTEASNSVSHSLKISKGIPDDNFFWWYQVYSGEMPVGEDLTLTAMIKTIDAAGKGPEISIRCDSADVAIQRATTQNNVTIIGTQDWTQYSVDLKNLGGNISKIYVFLIFQPGSTGTIYFDDISLTHK